MGFLRHVYPSPKIGENTMYQNLNPLDEYVNNIKGNINFLRNLLSPKVSLPLFAVCLMVIGLISIAR